MDALKIDKAIIAGFDWGARTADILAVALAGTVQGDCFRQRLPDYRCRGEPEALAANRRIRMVVSVLFRYRAQPAWL
jgi:hypothetical protein